MDDQGDLVGVLSVQGCMQGVIGDDLYAFQVGHALTDITAEKS